MNWSEYSTLKANEIEPGILVVSLNRPDKLDALNLKMLDEVLDLWHGLKHNLDIRVVVLKGEAEKGFCGGLDLNEGVPVPEYTGPLMYDWQNRLGEIELFMRQIPQPIICMVHGAAAGAGFSFAMASDIRVISTDARFVAAYVNVGIGGADMGCSYFLPRLIGAGRAYEFMLTGRFMNAEEAMQLGLASRCVERAQLMDAALDLARTIASKDPFAIRMTKEAINHNLGCAGLEAALIMENRNQIMMMMHNVMSGKGPVYR
jgi:enoyl-CoA hydratase/carnithine racemase